MLQNHGVPIGLHSLAWCWTDSVWPQLIASTIGQMFQIGDPKRLHHPSKNKRKAKRAWPWITMSLEPVANTSSQANCLSVDRWESAKALHQEGRQDVGWGVEEWLTECLGVFSLNLHMCTLVPPPLPPKYSIMINISATFSAPSCFLQNSRTYSNLAICNSTSLCSSMWLVLATHTPTAREM